MASVADGLELRRFVDEDLGKEVRLLVSTHYFSDHLAAFQLFPGVPIISLTAASRRMSTERISRGSTIAETSTSSLREGFSRTP
jgi:hypothetical protein